jgi:hypothetical protein
MAMPWFAQIETNNQQMLRSLSGRGTRRGGSGGIPAEVAAMLQEMDPQQLQAFFAAFGARRMGAEVP